MSVEDETVMGPRCVEKGTVIGQRNVRRERPVAGRPWLATGAALLTRDERVNR